MKIDVDKYIDKQLESLLKSKLYYNAVNQMVEELKKESLIAPNEKTIETRFDQYLTLIFNKLFEPLGHSYFPIKEEAVNTVRAISKGHADMSIGNVVIEFKQPSTLSSNNDKEDALKQAKDYIDGFIEAGVNKTFGMVTDGNICATYKLNSEGDFLKSEFVPMSFDQIDSLIKSIIGLGQKDFKANNLANDFAKQENSPSRTLAKSLFNTLNEAGTEKTRMLLTEWKHLFKLSHDDITQQQAIIDRRNTLSEYFQIELESVDAEYNALFSLQTSYAILIKLIAFKVISQVKYDDSLIHYSELLNLNNDALRLRMQDLESGSIIRDYGIQNLLEGDFFSWYSTEHQWNAEIAEYIRKIIAKLDRYTINFINDEEFTAHDFFKKLYQAIIPKPVRRSLGEYYTPHWLAEHVIYRSLELRKTTQWRSLDPTCGSGTFLTILINKVVEECKTNGFYKSDILRQITSRVIGIDLNPLAVLTSRVNYFLNISSFISFDTELEIPVYSGDSAYIPERTIIEDVPFVKYSFDTEIAPFPIYFPEIALRNLKKFSRVMIEIELDIIALNPKAVYNRLMSLVSPEEQDTTIIQNKLNDLSKKLIEFEKKKWNGIWARIVTNYLTTSNIGKFDLIVGNPPWVDWKNLPSLYREKIKSLEIISTIFSGDAFTGGINLNIAALITNVVLSNWLSDQGVLGMLMPDTFLVQQTYEGYRNLILADGSRTYFQEIHDWSNAGNPFSNVTQKFYTYYISKDFIDYSNGVRVVKYKKGRRVDIQVEALDFESSFEKSLGKAIQLNPNTTNFTIIKDSNLVDIGTYKLIAKKKSSYKGREGVEVYPQELLIFNVIDDGRETEEKITIENIKVSGSKFKMPLRRLYLEKNYLYPLIRGRDIIPFYAESKYVVPFVYDEGTSKQVAISEAELRSTAPNTYKYFVSVKSVFESQSGYSKNLINGKSIPFYSLARVGEYTFAPVFVAYRDNSKNAAAVVENIETPWGDFKRPVFQNHAVTISQRPDGSFISVDEAYYIAGVINCDSVNEFIKMSSDGRSFPINPRYQIPLYGIDDIIEIQNKISNLSKQAHLNYSDTELIFKIQSELNLLYLEMLELLE